MINQLPLKIAFRLIRGSQNSMISLTSIISIIGIMLGVAALIVGLSAMNGFETVLNNNILSVIPHGEIEPVNSLFNNWSLILKRIECTRGVLVAAPYIKFPSILEYNGNLQFVQIKGVDPALEMRFSKLPLHPENNIWLNFKSGSRKIIISKRIADILKVKTGNWITIIIPNSNVQTKLPKLKYVSVQVAGMLTIKNQLAYNIAMIPLVDAQQYLELGKFIDGIAIKVSDVFSANEIVHRAGIMTNSYVKTRSWIDSYGYIYQDINTIRSIIYLVITIVIAIACINIFSTLLKVVKYQGTDIAIFRTLGATNWLIRAIFFWYGLIIGITGNIIGTVIGSLIATNLTEITKKLEHLIGFKMLSENIYFIDFLPTNLHWIDVTNVFILVIMLVLIASWYPAEYASRTNPSQLLHDH